MKLLNKEIEKNGSSRKSMNTDSTDTIKEKNENRCSKDHCQCHGEKGHKHAHNDDENSGHENSHGHDHECENSHNHGCGCCDDEETNVKKVVIGCIAFFIALLFPYKSVLSTVSNETMDSIRLCIFLLIYFFSAGDIVRSAVRNLFKGKALDEKFLMTIASLGAFLVGDYSEGVAVMLFYMVGEAFQDYAVGKSRKSIVSLIDIRPDYANRMLRSGNIEKVAPELIKIGDIIMVKPGEKIPLDGIIIKGNASLDTSALTGESLPREAEENDRVISGSICTNGVLNIKVEKVFGESTVSKILDMVENAGNKKGVTENFISRFAKIYTPIVVACAVGLAVLVPLGMVFITGGSITDIGLWSKWTYRALTFLVISCPCALVISVPLSFFAGIGAASTNGILVKGSNYLEAMAQCDTVIFDKTGTLTKGKFTVAEVIEESGFTKNDVLEAACIAEVFSNHPIAISLKEYIKNENREVWNYIESIKNNIEIQEISGHGIKAILEGKTILAGNIKLMRSENAEVIEAKEVGTIVYVKIDEELAGRIVIRDEIKENAYSGLVKIKEVGISKTVMLTGDRKEIAEDIAEQLKIDEVYAQLLPGDKVQHVEELLKTSRKLAFVGDGINDAPVLARADIGIAMGALGSDAAIEAADIVLMDDNPEGIAKVIKIARKTIKIAKENIAFALGVKILILILSTFGFATMWAAVFADVGVAFIAILNAMRALRYKK